MRLPLLVLLAAGLSGAACRAAPDPPHLVTLQAADESASDRAGIQTGDLLTSW